MSTRGFFKKNIRRKHAHTNKIKQRFGKAEDTRDPDYEAAKEKCLQDGKRLKQIARHTEKLMQLLQTDCVVFGEVVDEFSQLNAGGPGMSELTSSLKEVEAARTKADATLQQDLCTPIYHFHQQYKILKRRMAELEVRRTDMDRFHDKVLKLTEKTTGAKDGLAEVDATYRTAREAYESLLKEMMADFAKLHKELEPFLAPAVAVFMREQAAYGQAYGEALGRLSSFAASVDTSMLQGYQHVITPPESSVAGAAGMLVEKKDKDKKGAAATTTAAAAVSAPAPATGSVMASTGTSTAPVQRPQPPPAAAAPAPKKAPQETARALFNFQGEDATELTFKKGDTITVLSKQGEWWEGELDGRCGLFPANYVQQQ